jgi:transcriptional regulator GlxA family with amidase domain
MQRIVIVAFDQVQTLDAAGPAEVFAAAERQTGRKLYDVVLASTGGRTLTSSSGFVVRSRDLLRIRPTRSDTVIVAGGEETPVTSAMKDERLIAWLQRAHKRVRRIGSVCSGAFVLAHAGLLDGRRAATHWLACDRLASFRPAVEVDRNAIFVRDGKVWTSAGVTTGIDMALAMVEEDHGKEIADGIASRLVLYVRRPGFQSQFSDALVAQIESKNALAPAITWARSHLSTLTVERFAKAAGLSMRTLHRRCLDHVGTTPAKLIERLRVEHARTLLSTTQQPVKSVAASCGFGRDDRMRRAFERSLGMGPAQYRHLHASQ